MNFIVEYAGYKSRKAPLLKGLQWCLFVWGDWQKGLFNQGQLFCCCFLVALAYLALASQPATGGFDVDCLNAPQNASWGQLFFLCCPLFQF